MKNIRIKMIVFRDGMIKCKISPQIRQLAKTKGAIVRSMIKWMEEGERNTKFFLNLEKKRAAINTIYQIKNDQGEIIM